MPTRSPTTLTPLTRDKGPGMGVDCEVIRTPVAESYQAATRVC
jgi:hypothetical protein